MSVRSLGSGSGRSQRRLSLENLERRSMLAGNVDVFVSGGNLIIRGDNNDNAVVVTQVDEGEYVVIGADFDDFESLPDFDFQSGPTVIRGGEDASDVADGARLFTGVIGNIDIDLKKGDDIVALGNSAEDLDALALDCLGFAFGSGSGGGNGTFSGVSLADVEPVEGRFFVPANLIINTGDGNDGVVVNADVRFDAVINTGKGEDGVAFGSPLFFGEIPVVQDVASLAAQQQIEEVPNVGDDLVVITGSQDDHVCVQGAVIHDHLNIQTNDGADEVSMQEVAAGHMLVVTGNQDDFVGMNTIITKWEIVVDTGAGNDEVFMELYIAGVDFTAEQVDEEQDPEDVRTHAGYVTVVTGAGNDEVEMFDLVADGVVINTGAGNDGSPGEASPITVENAFIDNHLNVITGAGNDLVEVEDIVAGSILIDTGAGNDGSAEINGEIGFFGNPIAVYNVDVERDVVVVTGAGNDIVYIYTGDEEESSNIGGNLIVNTGAGNDYALIIDQIVGNDLHLILGAGNDFGGVGASNGRGPGVQIGSLDVRHNLLIDAGAGNDEVGVGDVNVDNDAFLFLGAGHDELFMESVDIDRNALIDAGAGNDDVDINDSEVGETATILMGAGNDTLNIFNSFARKLRAFGGSGFDTFNNDLGIDANGTYDFGDSSAEVREFEEFNEID